MDDKSQMIQQWGNVRDNAEEWPEEWYSANMRAFLALGGMYSDVVGIVIRLLRSATPLHPVFRSVLADAIEGTRPEGTANFKMKGVPKHSPSNPETRDRFRRDIEIGEFIADSIAKRKADGDRATRGPAELEAAAKFPVSVDTAHKITTGYRKMMKWVDDVERRRGEHHLVMAQIFEELGKPDLAEQERARAKAEKEAPPMTAEQRRSFCLNTYLSVGGSLTSR